MWICKKFAALLIILVLALAHASCSSSGSKTKTIYGSDNRTTLTSSPHFSSGLQNSIALLTKKFRLKKSTDEEIQLKSASYGEFFGLCKNEAFYDEPVLGDCTGFLISPSLLMTAGHCVSSADECEQRAFVFNASDPNKTIFKSSEIFTCRRIVHSLSKEQGDIALVELDRPVETFNDSKYFRLPKPHIEDHSFENLITLGHPSGLPMKAAPFEGLIQNTGPTYFYGKADVLGGSSGSPLFVSETGELAGVLVGGEADFVWDGTAGCSRSRVCTGQSCGGERFTHARVLSVFFH